ncbi:MAG: peptide ABC transporter substrate-binding protein [Phycisphaerae bacterium]|nr:peptide ABC transporter substrate-binding protein [Phycisphaerae bacterium]
MLRIFIIFIIVLLISSLGFLIFLQKPLPQADYTFALVGTVKTLDPAKVSWSDDIRLALGLWEGLLAYDPVTTEAVEGVAQLPVDISDDRLVYTFTLRQEARWSNGDPVTAHDFVYGWRRVIEPGKISDYAFLIADNIAGAREYRDWRFEAVRILTILRDLARGVVVNNEDMAFLKELDLQGMDQPTPNYTAIADTFRNAHLEMVDGEFARVGIEALDDHHLRVTLIRPVAYFQDLVAFPTFMPVHQASMEMLRERNDPAVVDLTLWVTDTQWVKPDYHKNAYPGVVSNGAYRLKRWEFKRFLLLEKNQYYWDQQPGQLDTIMARVITDLNAAFMAYEQGDLDMLHNMEALDFAAALYQQKQAGKRDDLHFTMSYATYFYMFNCNQKLPDGSPNPFGDKRVRMAFNLAVDKQSVVDNVQRIGNPATTNFIPVNSIKGYTCQPGPGHDIQRARALLAEAGYPNGQGLPTIEFIYNTTGGHEKTAESVAEMWRKNLNVNISLDAREYKIFDDDKKNQRYMVCRSGWTGDYSDPTTFLDMMITGNGQNDAAFSNPEYDRLMALAVASKDKAERFKILAQAEKMIIQDEMPILPLFNYVSVMAFRENVKGIHPNPRDMYPYKYIRVEK